MAIDKISSDIQSRQIIHGRVNEATSGKKEKVDSSVSSPKKASLGDHAMFSQDARRLQEIEVILQNALQKLHEMDDINKDNLAGIHGKIEEKFYDQKMVAEVIADDIFPEEQLRKTVEQRMIAEKYTAELKKLDTEESIDLAKIDLIKERVKNGYYNNSQEVASAVAESLLEILDV
jgi:predicted small metal-binding protein